MAPTIQTGAANERQKRGVVEKKSDLVCRVKFCNTLPDIPFDPKFITYPFLPNRFVEYKPTSLERNYKHDLLTEHDLGVTIDLINPDTYAIDPLAILHEDDDRLLEEDALTPQDSKRSRHHNKTVPWLKKTEYISNEFNRYGHSSEKTETKVGYNVKKLFKEDNIYMDRDSQINAINKTFSDAKQDIEKHYSKPGVYPVEVLPVFPDFDMWQYPFAQVMFDTDPAPPSQAEDMSQAMIRGVMDESGEQFVAYFLPSEETTRKRKRDADEGIEYEDFADYEYKMVREYNWNVKNKASKGYEENYFLVMRDGAMYYNELETRVRLSKRRAKPGTPIKNSLLVIKHRPLNEVEYNQQKARMSQLEPAILEEEEEEDEDAEQEGEAEDGEEESQEREHGEEEENREEDDEEETLAEDDEDNNEETREDDDDEQEAQGDDDEEAQEEGEDEDKEEEDDREEEDEDNREEEDEDNREEEDEDNREEEDEDKEQEDDDKEEEDEEEEDDD